MVFGVLNLGEVLKAYQYLADTGIVPIVKLDEFEKLQVCQAFFLPVVYDRACLDPASEGNNGYIGVAKYDQKPIVILTSNNQHVVHPPLRSRCVYTRVRLPTDIEEARILRSRVPEALSNY